MRCLWKAELLGRLCIRGEHGEHSRFRTQRTGWLLAYLAYHLGEPQSREVVAERIWPDDDAMDARRKLTVALSSLRQQLEPTGVPHDSVLIATRDTVGLRAEAVTSDVAQYYAHLKAAEQASNDRERLARLRQGLDLYSGTLLPGCYVDWVTFEAQRLETLYLGNIRRLIPLLEAQGELTLALEYAIRAASIDPLGQETRHTLARLYVAAGRPHRALAECEAIARLVQEELGGAMTPELQGLTHKLRSRAGHQPRGQREPFLPSAQRAVPAAVLFAGAPSPPANIPSTPAVDGILNAESPFYLPRSTDRQLFATLDGNTGLIRLKGRPQSGKTSLLVRAAEYVRARGCRVVWTDLEPLNPGEVGSRELFRTFAAGLWRQCRPPQALAECWDPMCPDAVNLTDCVEHLLRQEPDRPLFWIFDHLDQLLASPLRRDFCAMIRAWSTRRTYYTEGGWNRLIITLAYSSETSLSPADGGASPLNFGARIWLEDFDLTTAAELNRRHGTPLKDAADLERFHAWTAGHPWLLQAGLTVLAERREPLTLFEPRSVLEREPYGDHLRRLQHLLREHHLEAALRDLLAGRPASDPQALGQLDEWGVLRGDVVRGYRPRCGLYDRYFRLHLLTGG